MDWGKEEDGAGGRPLVQAPSQANFHVVTVNMTQSYVPPALFKALLNLEMRLWRTNPLSTGIRHSPARVYAHKSVQYREF